MEVCKKHKIIFSVLSIIAIFLPESKSKGLTKSKLAGRSQNPFPNSTAICSRAGCSVPQDHVLLIVVGCVVLANRFSSHAPHAFFARTLVVAIQTPDGRVSLQKAGEGALLKVHSLNNGLQHDVQEVELNSEIEMLEALRSYFGITF